MASGSPEELKEMMQMKAELRLVVLGTREQTDTILQEIEGIESYEIEEAEEADSVKIRLDIAGNQDIRKELSMALSGAGLPILSMNRTEKSLEDIFLELTDTETEEGGENEKNNAADDITEEKEDTGDVSDL